MHYLTTTQHLVARSTNGKCGRHGRGPWLHFVILLAFVSAGFALADEGQWVRTLGGEPTSPYVRIAKSDATGVGLRVTVPGFRTATKWYKAKKYGVISLPKSGYTATIGEPRLPVIRKLLIAPHGAVVSARAVGRAQTHVLKRLGIHEALMPRQRPIPKIPGAFESAPLDKNEHTYKTDAFAPAWRVRVKEAGVVSGRRLVMVEIAPIAYNPVKKALRVYPRLDVRVSFKGGKRSVLPLSRRERTRLRRLALNYTDPGETKSAKPGQRLLIIAHDDFVGDLSGFVAHKTGLGFIVDLVGTSTAGTTTAAIKAYIQSRYDDPGTRPDALLLVGDTGQIPQFIGGTTDNPDTDLYYTCMDSGDDWQPEFPVGRFSVTSTGQLTAVVDKTIGYATALPGNWMGQAVFMAGTDNYTVTEGTHNWVITNYMAPQGYISDKLYMVTYGATTQQVRDAFNAGRVFGIYSGHGSQTSWGDGPPFSQSDVNGLTNAGMYPFVCSFSCLTGDYSVSECFAETWQRAADKAAVAMLASSVYSYWTEDDILEKKLFVAIFDDGLSAFGEAVVRAKEHYLTHFGATSTTRRYFEMYNLFGDPTAALRKPPLRIVTPSPLPMAYVDEPYSVALEARGGITPYSWDVIAGTLPPGLSLDPNTGIISGTPSSPGTANFTAQVTDAVPETATRVFDLPVVERLEITTPSPLPSAAEGVPYSVTLECQGGTGPYTWSVVGEGDYTETDPGGGWLGGGTAQGWNGDDASYLLDLPWAFNFYGAAYSSVHVCTNGFIDFASGSTDYSSTEAELRQNVRIAPLWDDLTMADGGDIYVTESADYVAIRWMGETWDWLGEGDPVDFEVVLYRNGQIRFNYGITHSNIYPVVGISKGDEVNYVLSVWSGQDPIPVNTSSLFTPASPLPPGLSLDPATGEISGTPTETGTWVFDVRVDDSGDPHQADTREFSLTVGVPRTLTVESDPISGVDITGTRPGTTTYTAAVAEGGTETLIAPRMVSDGSDHYIFVRWLINDVPQPDGQTSVTFQITGDTTAIAVYEERRKGDFDGDGDVDFSDFMEFVDVYGLDDTDPGWQPNGPIGDFDDDADVDPDDFQEFQIAYGA